MASSRGSTTTVKDSWIYTVVNFNDTGLWYSIANSDSVR